MRGDEITIREPWYGAGSPKVFNWVKDYGIIGIGINIEKLRIYDSLLVTIKKTDERLVVDCQRALELAKQYNAYKSVGSGVTLAVVPVSAFMKVSVEA